jgi:hypothetical protein
MLTGTILLLGAAAAPPTLPRHEPGAGREPHVLRVIDRVGDRVLGSGYIGHRCPVVRTAARVGITVRYSHVQLFPTPRGAIRTSVDYSGCDRSIRFSA